MSGFVTPETMAADENASDVIAYGVGICHASVCAPASLPVDDVLAAVNARWPTGLDHGWVIATAETFSDGLPNPCPCEQTTGRVHRLLEC
jgi:hypothetical protein